MALKSASQTIGVRFYARGRILDATTVPASSGWHRVNGAKPISITMGGTASSITWQVYVTNQLDAPTTDNNATWGPAQTGKTAVEITVPYEHIKVDISAVSGGNAFVDVWAG